jgi:hypothetical protein
MKGTSGMIYLIATLIGLVASVFFINVASQANRKQLPQLRRRRSRNQYSIAVTNGCGGIGICSRVLFGD